MKQKQRKMKKLSENFTLEEMIVSPTAARMGIDNTPTPIVITNLRNLVKTILQPAREFLGIAIFVTSGFRCKMLNIAIGGSRTSQHMKGEAADLQCADNAALFRFIYENCKFDQLIWEFGDDDQPLWVHVSRCFAGNRQQVLRARTVSGKTVYEKFNGNIQA